MTLVELLVVVAILGLLAVTVLPTVASTTESRRSREAARVASSFFSSAQSRAFGRREWSGFRVVPAPAGNMALDLAFVEVPPAYRGDLVGAQLTVVAPVPNANFVTAAAVGAAIASFQTLGVGSGNLIRFADRDPWYQITNINPGGISFEKRLVAGQSSTNTPWPPTGNQPFEIALAPVPYGAPVTLGEGRVIDLRWSGFIDPGTGNYIYFTNPGAVSVLYDGTGRLRRIVYPGPISAPILSTDAPGAIFFLVGRADRAGQFNPATFNASDDTTGCNWQYADSVWVMINPATGTVHQASCKPGTGSVRDSQEWVRSYLSAGGGS